MPTRPEHSEQAILKDARDVLAVAKKRIKDFVAADKDKKIKTISPAFLTALAKKLGDYAAVAREQGKGKESSKKATRGEQAQRKALSDAMVEIRNDIRDTYPDDAALQRAFGVGRKLTRDSTPLLVTAAGDLCSAFDTHGKAASDAG